MFDKGKLLYHDGTVEYSGSLKDGKPFGKGTQYNFKNGNVKIEGNFNKNGNLQGEGTIYFEDDDVVYYQGNFLDGKKHGYGVEYYSNKLVKYHGFWLLGKVL